jgi:predicted nucleic acid-binding protein
MKLGVDTNVLVVAHMPSMEDHAIVRARLRERLADAATILVITPAILHELVHVITDARRFDPPVAVMEAVAVARVYLDASNVQCVPTDAAAARLTLELVERHRLGRKRLADSLFAATLLRNDVNTLLTFNHGDFGVFEGLSTIDPRAELD